MKRWWVVTPEYNYHEIIDPEIGGPWYETCDAVLIEARSARDAIKLGVVEMLRNPRHYQYCRNQRLSDASPYTGVYAQEEA